MLKALYVLAMLTGWGPAYQFGLLSYSAATYENQYYEILRLHRESQRLPESERSQRAQALADKVLRTYESLEYLSFSQETIDFWCTEGSWQSYLPMEYWPKETVATARTLMRPRSLHTEILVQDRPLYSLFLKDMQFSEYRWPWNGMSGAYTRYSYDPRSFRLCKGVEAHVMCVTGTLRIPWIGRVSRTPWFEHAEKMGRGMSNQPLVWQHRIGEGKWIGRSRDQLRRCDVVLLDQDHIDRRDVFFVDRRGFVILWYIIIRETDNHENKWIVPTRYRDYQTDPIADTEFLPSEAFARQTQDWRCLTEAEALAEFKEVRGEALPP